MKLIKFDNARKYYGRVEKYLLQNEAINCLVLASGLSLCDKDCHQAYLALVKDNQDILATAIHTCDRKLLLSKSMNLSAVKQIAGDLVVDSRSIPGVTAPQLEAETFVADWQNRTEQSIELEMVMSIQQLEKINDIDSAVGKLRLAVLEETELLTDWIQAFVKEALGINESKAAMRKWVIRYIEQDSLYVWENKNQSVSMAACGGKTNKGIRVQSIRKSNFLPDKPCP